MCIHFGDDGGYAVCRAGPAEVETLGSAATQFAQRGHRHLVLHALGGHRQSQRTGEVDGRSDDGRVGWAVRHTADEGSVDFEFLHRQSFDVGE